MTTIDIRPLEPVTAQDLQPLLQASLAEGYDFIQKLWDEYQSGANRFDAPGAVLLAVYDEAQLVAVGGIHPDPYLRQADIGRVRHVYVMPDQRRTGVGRQLMNALIAHTRAHYPLLTLRTPTAHGDAFYRALGFSTQPRFDQATHWMALNTDAGTT